jgi:uncharacterized membrane protein YdfJ with MMPL/SSD domain
VLGRLVARIVRRPGRALAANLALLAVAAALAVGAPDRLAVSGGLGSYAESDPAILIVAAEAKPALGDAVARQALTVIRSGLDADPRVEGVEAVDLERRSDVAVLEVDLADLSARDRQEAAEEIAADIDPGPLEVAVGGEAMVQAAARDRLEDELGGLALLALPLVAVALLLAFGVRHALAPLMASATGALGAIGVLGLLAEVVDLGAAGLATAVAVGLAVGTEGCAALRRDHLAEPTGSPEERIGRTLGRAGRTVAVAAGGGALASLATIAIALPAARSAAIGGALAALLAAASALIAMPSLLALTPAQTEGEANERDAPVTRVGARLRDLAAMRPWLGWLPALLVLAVLVIVGAHAFDPEASSDLADDAPASQEAARAAELVSRAASKDAAAELLAAPRAAGPLAREEIASGLPWIAALVTLLGLGTGYAAIRSWRGAFVRGAATALPALAVVGILTLAGKGNPPLGIDLGRLAGPQVSALLVALAAVGAVSTARAALADPWTALPGTVVAGAALAVLAGSDLTGVAQAGVAVAAGLVIDLVLVRAILVPALARAVPLARPGVGRLRLPGRFGR